MQLRGINDRLARLERAAKQLDRVDGLDYRPTLLAFAPPLAAWLSGESSIRPCPHWPAKVQSEAQKLIRQEKYHGADSGVVIKRISEDSGLIVYEFILKRATALGDAMPAETAAPAVIKEWEARRMADPIYILLSEWFPVSLGPECNELSCPYAAEWGWRYVGNPGEPGMQTTARRQWDRLMVQRFGGVLQNDPAIYEELARQDEATRQARLAEYRGRQAAAVAIAASGPAYTGGGFLSVHAAAEKYED